MKKGLWQDCLDCEEKCCGDFAIPLFLTPEERKKHPALNTKCPCVFFGRGVCEIHSTRPIDCRLFPFDIMLRNEKFFWIVWDVICPIVKSEKNDLEEYLRDHEKNLIPKFVKYIADYARFREKEMDSKFKYQVLREIQF